MRTLQFICTALITMMISISAMAQQVRVIWSGDDTNLTYWDGQNIQTLTTDIRRKTMSKGNILYMQGNDLKLWDGASTTLVQTLEDNGFDFNLYDKKVAFIDNGQDMKVYENGQTQTIFTKGVLQGMSVAAVTEAYVVIALTNRGQISSGEILVWDGVQIRTLSELTGATDFWQSRVSGEGQSLVWQRFPFMGKGSIFYWDGVNAIEIADSETSFTNPQISGSTLVFEGRPLSGGSSQIFTWENGNLIQLTFAENDQIEPEISNGHIVWLGNDGNDFEVYSYKNGEAVRLTNNDVDDADVTVEGSYVAWSGIVDDYRNIFIYDGISTSGLSNPASEWRTMPVISVFEGSDPAEPGNCTIIKDTVYAIQNLNSGLNMDVSNASLENSARIIQFGTSTPNHRLFTSLSKGSGYFGFRGFESRRFFDIAGAQTDDGADLQQWGLNANVDHRQFMVAPGLNGACTIKPKHSGKCLGVRNASVNNAAQIEQQTCNGSAAQEWVFTKQ